MIGNFLNPNTALFHICGHEHFESIIDFVASALQMVAIACVVALKRNSNLTTVAHIQVLVGFFACVAKVGYPIFKGWEKPFRDGLACSLAPFQVCERVQFLFLVLGSWTHAVVLPEPRNVLVFDTSNIPSPYRNSTRIWRMGSFDHCIAIPWSC